MKRKIWFDRLDLSITKQKQYSHEGKLETEVAYNDFQEINTQIYPKVIHIRKPNDSYSLMIRSETIQFNVLLDDRVFILDKFPRAKEIDLTKEI